MPTARFPGNGNYQLDASFGVNGSTIYISSAVDKLGGGGYYTYSGQPWVGGSPQGPFASGTWLYDFRSSSRIAVQSNAAWGPLAPGTYSMSISVTMADGIGTATVYQDVTVGGGPPPGGQTPSKPTDKPTIEALTPTSVTYKYTGAGVVVVDGWDSQLAIDAAFSQVASQTLGTLSDRVTVPGIAPNGQAYFVRYRASYQGRKGPWSDTTTFNTPNMVAPTIVVTPSLQGQSASIALSGAESGGTYILERRDTGTTTPVTTVSSKISPIVVDGLVQGKSYDWRAAYQMSGGGNPKSPYSTWKTVTQPNPNVSPGDYFDGDTADVPPKFYDWENEQGISRSIATSLGVLGWLSFAAGVGASGANVGHVTQGVVSLASAGAHAAVVTFQKNATAPGFQGGTSNLVPYTAEVDPSGTYTGTIYVQPSRAARMRAEIAWLNSSGAAVGAATLGAEVQVAANTPVRLSARGAVPAGATHAAVRWRDVAGTGANLWQVGDTVIEDAAMLTVGDHAYFDGGTPDTPYYDYQWTDPTKPNLSPSARVPLTPDTSKLLVDPNCPTPPPAPRPPLVKNSCIIEGTVWHRSYVIVPASDVSAWMTEVPTFTVRTGDVPVNQVRFRLYPYDGVTDITDIDVDAWESEQIISYIPADTTLVLDGVSEHAWASTGGFDDLSADHLLYGSNGGPASWPKLRCNATYLVALDTPTEDAEGKPLPAHPVDVTATLTRRG